MWGVCFFGCDHVQAHKATVDGEQRGVGAGENADFAGVALARLCPETAPTLGNGQKKSQAIKLGISQISSLWWRRGELNPRPQILCRWPYMLSLVFNLTFRCPTGRATNGGSGKVLEPLPRTGLARACVSRPLKRPERLRTSQASSGQRLAGLSRQCVAVVVGDYNLQPD